MSQQQSAHSAPRVVAFCGNNQRPSKSRALVEAVIEELQSLGIESIDIYDLIDLGNLGDAKWKGDLEGKQKEIIDAIEHADALIVGTPVYKGSYAGLFKHVIDLLDQASLRDKPVCITACGGGYRHALVVEHQLRPLFGFFNALALPTAVYAGEPDFNEGKLTNPEIRGRAKCAAQELARQIVTLN